MESLILTKEKLARRRFENGLAEEAAIVVGNVDNLPVLSNSPISILPSSKDNDQPVIVEMGSPVYQNTKAEKKLKRDMQAIVSKYKKIALKNGFTSAEALTLQNAGADYPDDLLSLIYAVQIDLTRRIMQEADYTDFVSQVITNPNFTKSVNLQELQRYTGAFKKNNLNGEAVPLIQQKTGAKDSVNIDGYALGWTHTLSNLIFNVLFDFGKVNDAFVRAFVGLRNALCIGQIIQTDPGTSSAATRTYTQEMTVDADTEGITYDDRLYQTFNNAIKVLMGLRDYQTKKRINAPSMVLLVGSGVAAYDIDRVIRGQLNNSKGQNANREPLTKITDIIVYDGDVFDWNDERISYPPVPDGVAYLFVPGSADAPWWTLVKSGLSQITSQGDALTLSQERIARWFAQGTYSDEFFGESSANTKLASETIEGVVYHYGYIVKINLPEAET